jgi:predicted dehydrogenase
VHIPVFQATPGITVVAVASSSRDRAERVAGKFGIPHAFDDYHELAQLPDLDLVAVATTPSFHCSVALAAVEAGKHVLCEKPMAMNADESQAMLTAARKKGVLHLMNFEFRTTPARQRMKQLIDGGYLGQIRHVHVSVFSGVFEEYGRYMRRWWFRQETGGGWLGGLGSHFIDALRYWFGEVEGVSAQLRTLVARRNVGDFDDPQDVDADDTFSLLLKFRNGASGAFTSSAVTSTPEDPRVSAYGSDGTLVLVGDCLYGARTGEGQLVEMPVDEDEAPGDESAVLDPHYIPFTRWARTIAGAIRAGRQLAPSFEDGLRCQQVMDAARRSSAEGRWVDIED